MNRPARAHSPPELKFRAKVGRQFCVRARRDEGAGWAPVTEEQRSHDAKGPASFIRNFSFGGIDAERTIAASDDVLGCASVHSGTHVHCIWLRSTINGPFLNLLYLGIVDISIVGTGKAVTRVTSPRVGIATAVLAIAAGKVKPFAQAKCQREHDVGQTPYHRAMARYSPAFRPPTPHRCSRSEQAGLIRANGP